MWQNYQVQINIIEKEIRIKQFVKGEVSLFVWTSLI